MDGVRGPGIARAAALTLVGVGALACAPEPELEPEACDPGEFESAQLSELTPDQLCGHVSQASSVADREQVRDCMLAAAAAGEGAYAWVDSGVDSTSQWRVYVRPGEDPPAWGVSFTSDSSDADEGRGNHVSAYPCTGIAATAECDENSPAFCVDCVGLADESAWSCD